MDLLICRRSPGRNPKLASLSSSTRKSLSGTTSKAKDIKTAVSEKKSGSPTAAKSLDFSGQILQSDAAHRRLRACSLLMRHR